MPENIWKIFTCGRLLQEHEAEAEEDKDVSHFCHRCEVTTYFAIYRTLLLYVFRHILDEGPS